MRDHRKRPRPIGNHAAGKHRSRRPGACCGCATRPAARLTIRCRVPPAARRRRSGDCRATV